MKLNCTLFILIILFSLISCSKQPENNNPFLHIKIPVNQLQQINMSDFISDFKAVKLEFTDESMLHSVRKVELFDELLYVLDSFGAKGVLVYDMNGKFIRKIGSAGRGPGQYSIPQDFLIDKQNNEIEILANRTVFHFSLNGNYLKDQTIDFTGINFIKSNKSYYFAITGKEDYKLTKTNLNCKRIESYLPTNNNYENGVAYCCLIPQESGQILYRPLRRDTIYSVGTSEAFPYRIIDFGKYKFHLNEFEKMPFIEQAKFLKYGKNTDQCIIRNYFENSHYIDLVYNMSGNFYEYILNKETGTFRHFGNETLTDDIIWQKDARWIVGGDEEYVYFSIEPYKYSHPKLLRRFLESFTNDESYIQELLHETSNPIILLAKYKKL